MDKDNNVAKQPPEAEDGGGAEPNEVDPADEQGGDGDYIPPADEDTMSILSIIPNDHDRIKGLYRRYKDPTDSPHQRQLLAYQLLRELTVHMLAEEQVVYPLIAEMVDEHMRDHAVDEHDSLKLFSSDLENQKVEDEGFDDKMHQLMETFLEHIHEEEHTMLAALREVLDEPQLRDLGKSFEAAKQHVPTRPHLDASHAAHIDDATVLLDAARDAAAFGGTPPPLGSDSTAVLKEVEQQVAPEPAGAVA